MSSSMASVPELYSGFEMAAALRLLCSDEHTAHSTRAIVWDDCTAATRFNIDSLDSWLQYVLSSPQPFGNIPVIFAADWTGTGHPIPSDVAPNFFGVSPLNAAIAGRLTYLHLPGDIPYVALPETAAQGVLHRPVAVSSQVSSLDDLIGPGAVARQPVPGPYQLLSS
ncbi:hypothetical protein OC835_006602 [Tilletia horrida]|nr:hypothetical protein OC835_006602 [Tilletia horrida]